MDLSAAVVETWHEVVLGSNPGSFLDLVTWGE